MGQNKEIFKVHGVNQQACLPCFSLCLHPSVERPMAGWCVCGQRLCCYMSITTSVCICAFVQCESQKADVPEYRLGISAEVKLASLPEDNMKVSSNTQRAARVHLKSHHMCFVHQFLKKTRFGSDWDEIVSPAEGATHQAAGEVQKKLVHNIIVLYTVSCAKCLLTNGIAKKHCHS